MSRDHVSEKLRRFVVRRARNRCEYCLLPQNSQEATFHIDHIHPRDLGGKPTADNLALACVGCSLRKGARSTGVDPDSRGTVRLFHPRHDKWRSHFRWTRQWRVAGRSAAGRATVESLQLNRSVLIRIRKALARQGEFPAL